jgi:monoamine oxidase
MAIGAMAAGFIPLSGAAQAGRSATGYLRTNWSRDPFSYGAYSYLAKGARRRDHVALGTPVGARLFFAGEAAHPEYNSTVHAAYESGQIAAEAIYETEAERVAVIGAGASGLAAASALIAEGYEVTLWEARDRIGGRVWTDSGLGMPLDLGASWIHGTDGNPLAELAATLGVKIAETEDTAIMRGRGGRRIPEVQRPGWLEDVFDVEHDYGADPEDLNVATYDNDADYDGPEVIFPQGYAQLFQAIPEGLEIQLNRVLREVAIEDAGVRLTDQAGQMARFDAVVVTVPLGVLKQGDIRFDPPLPAGKQAAIDRLGMGLLDKLFLRYDEVFWDRDVTWIETPETGLPRGQFNQWVNFYPYIGEPVIMAFNGAQPARDLAGLSDADFVARAEAVLNSVYPDV